MNDIERAKILRKASWLGIILNGFLAIIKIFFGFFAHSLAIIGDGIDSFTDIFSSLITLFTSKVISEPPDREHPWGHGRAETLSTTVLSFIIFFAGFQLLIGSIESLFNEELKQLPRPMALWVTLISVIVKIFLALYKFQKGKKIESRLLMADAVNMRNDIFLSLSVFIGIGLTIYFQLPIIDSLASLLLSLFILYSAYDIFKDANLELMDSIEDQAIYEELFESLGDIKGLHNPHRCRIRKINNLYDIDLDIEVDGNLTLKEAHNISIEAETAVKTRLKQVFDIMIHVEPLGNIEHREQYGLNPQSIKTTPEKDK
ncbi:MAG: cation diffusion facilitator family transporter [Spirochaetaceae bacterium]|nr:cation diffusion facilitator family transporter [Spirochaetaceae bacterium]